MSFFGVWTLSRQPGGGFVTGEVDTYTTLVAGSMKCLTVTNGAPGPYSGCSFEEWNRIFPI